LEVLINTDFKQLYLEERARRMELEAEVMKMKMQIQKFSQMIFGSQSERFIANPAQLSLDMAVDAVGATTKLSDVKKVEYISTTKAAVRSLDQMGGYLEGLARIVEVREPKNLPKGAVKLESSDMRY